MSVPVSECMSVRVCEFVGYDYDKFINAYLDEENQGDADDHGDKPAEPQAVAMTSVCFSPHPSCYLLNWFGCHCLCTCQFLRVIFGHERRVTAIITLEEACKAMAVTLRGRWCRGAFSAPSSSS